MGTNDVIYTPAEERAYNRGRQDVAREMIDEFKELVELSKIAGGYADIVIKNGIANLEKKYIGEQR